VPEGGVAVLVPAYNEEAVICKTVDTLLASTLEADIIVIDDGSSDRTSDVVRETYPGVERVKVHKKENGGKSAALNFGITQTEGYEVIVAIDGDTMLMPDVFMSIFEGEAELAVVIGKRASHVPEAQAMDHVFGYVNFIDGSARGLKPERNSFFQMKSRDTFAPIGPYLVTKDEIADPQKLRVRLSVNGTVKQDFNTSDMAHKIPRCIAWASSIHTLEPGDILATGTNHRGLSAFMDGDQVELEVEGLGALRFSVRDELKRTWSRETRLDRQKQGFDTPTPQIGGKYAPAKG
jgi:glycosyltransferase involved in cell wall biosynthesis